jgi:hypothetical protein
MTKTEQKLIDLARANGGKYVICTAVGTGPFGGRIHEGQRDRDAMYKLIDKGLVRLTSKHRCSESRRGHTVAFYNYVFEFIV